MYSTPPSLSSLSLSLSLSLPLSLSLSLSLSLPLSLSLSLSFFPLLRVDDWECSQEGWTETAKALIEVEKCQIAKHPKGRP